MESESIQDNDHMTESRDPFLPDMWESDSRLSHVTNESRDLGHEGIGDENHRSSTADCRPPTTNHRSPNADR